MAVGKPEWPEFGDLLIDTTETVTGDACPKLAEHSKRVLFNIPAGWQSTFRRDK
ncbi:MAG: hypothetical protein ABSD92_00195 [Candidatus Bathyarchaeia archaeon]|jgi:hypothetical protein